MIQFIDTHTHTSFSPDSEQDPEELVRAAIGRGLKYLAITDHQENEFHPSKWEVDFYRYFRELERLRAKYGDRIELAAGVEIGYAPQCDGMAREIIESYSFDTVIQSIHNLGGVDLYYETYYVGKTKREAYANYLAAVKDSVLAPYPFTQIGHLGYIARYAHYADRTLRYGEFAEEIDNVLRAIVDRDVVLECNTSSEGMGQTAVTPIDVLRRFYELGGRRVTFASDAHGADRLCDKFAETVGMLRELGFRELTYCKGMRKYGLPI